MVTGGKGLWAGEQHEQKREDGAQCSVVARVCQPVAGDERLLESSWGCHLGLWDLHQLLRPRGLCVFRPWPVQLWGLPV